MFSRRQQTASQDTTAEDDSRTGGRRSSGVPSFSLTKTFSMTPIVQHDGASVAPRGPLGLTLLYSSPNPEVELIFVHGLGGDSRKTWCKSSDPSTFWPQEWLPGDPEFGSVRIHSYGYDTQYLKSPENCMNVHHIGKSLLGALQISACIASSSTRIVLIGHSMGGLVIKKAFILGRQDAACKSLMERFASIVFLATPHRGADSAKMLKNILRAVRDRDRVYLGDLDRKSRTIQVINDEFRHHSENLELWSFYETQFMKYFNSLVVDPESAILGYREEKQIPMDANHRSICKYDSQLDVNYRTVRDALASIIENITKKREDDHKISRTDVKALKKYLAVSDMIDDDLLTAQESRMESSCNWITRKNEYLNWMKGGPDSKDILWIKGKPATGKSILASYIVDLLKKSGHACNYFFFKHGDHKKSRLETCLRHLAFQMSVSCAEALQATFSIRDEDSPLDYADARTIWHAIFQNGIFKTDFPVAYWVIDALDECSDSSTFFRSVLTSMTKSGRLKILVTSRDTVELGRDFSTLPVELYTLSISADDTLADLERLVCSKVETMPQVDARDRKSLTEKIMQKSKGSFLWTILVLKELMGCHGASEIGRTLDELPRGMKPLYQRTLEQMSQNSRGKELAKAILVWATCSMKPMKIGELSGALSHDIQDSFPKLEESIAALCGHLVVVDKFKRVQMIHETARDFLFENSAGSEFAIQKRQAHTKIARSCLGYLVSDEMKPPRIIGRSTRRKRSDFAVYAYTAFSYHISKSDPKSAELFQLLLQFTKSNILTWIEAIAESQDLNQLIYASKRLRTYLDASCIERSPLDPRMHSLRQWVVDLVRLAPKFSNALITFPQAIYSIVPGFCPTASMIFNISGQSRRIVVTGTSSEQWEDRLLCLDFHPGGRPTTVCYGEEFLAVGLTTGAVFLYYTISYQQYKQLDHGENVRFIKFMGKTGMMASCGFKMIKIWDIKTASVIYNLKTPRRPFDMAFDGSMLLVAGQGTLSSWDLNENALPQPDRPWYDSPELDRPPLRQAPSVLSMSINMGMLAVAYVWKPILLWDLKENAFFGTCGRKLPDGETNTHRVVALALNPNPDIGLLAALYLDGYLALLDPFTDQELECFRTECQTLASSPNGCLLAAGAAHGVVNVYEFDTLKLLYRVKSFTTHISQLSFCRDNQRLADIRGTYCTVWEPASLIRSSLNDDSSGITCASIVDTVFLDAKSKIIALAVHPTCDVVFCGKQDGTVAAYCGKTSKFTNTLYTHTSPVHFMLWYKMKSSLLTTDINSEISLRKISRSTNRKWMVEDIPQCHFDLPPSHEDVIMDILIGEETDNIFVSMGKSVFLFNLNGTKQAHRIRDTDPGTTCGWITHPSLPMHIVCLGSTHIRIFSWIDLSEIASYPISRDIPSFSTKCLFAFSMRDKAKLLIEVLEKNGSPKTSAVLITDLVLPDQHRSLTDPEQGVILNMSDKNSEAGTRRTTISTDCDQVMQHLEPLHAVISQQVSHVVGISRQSKLIFLDYDNWICSYPLHTTPLKENNNTTAEYMRHCFIPLDWFAGTRDVVCSLSNTDIIFARGGDLATIRNCFQLSNVVKLRA